MLYSFLFHCMLEIFHKRTLKNEGGGKVAYSCPPLPRSLQEHVGNYSAKDRTRDGGWVE